MVCPILQKVTQNVLQAPDCPLERLGLSQPSRNSLLSVACTFSAYHAVKRLVSTWNMQAHSTLDKTQLNAVYGLFAETLAVEARDAELPLVSSTFRPDSQFVDACMEFNQSAIGPVQGTVVFYQPND